MKRRHLFFRSKKRCETNPLFLTSIKPQRIIITGCSSNQGCVSRAPRKINSDSKHDFINESTWRRQQRLKERKLHGDSTSAYVKFNVLPSMVNTVSRFICPPLFHSADKKRGFCRGRRPPSDNRFHIGTHLVITARANQRVITLSGCQEPLDGTLCGPLFSSMWPHRWQESHLVTAASTQPSPAGMCWLR